MDERTAIIEKLKKLGIGAWCEHGQVVFNPNESSEINKNINELNNQPVSR